MRILCLLAPGHLEVFTVPGNEDINKAFPTNFVHRHRETENIVAAKYLIQDKAKVRAEAEVLRDLVQSAFIVQLSGLFESSLNCVLVTEYLAGGDLVTRTAADEFCLTERKCQIFIRQVSILYINKNVKQPYCKDCQRCAIHTQPRDHPS